MENVSNTGGGTHSRPPDHVTKGLAVDMKEEQVRQLL